MGLGGAKHISSYSGTLNFKLLTRGFHKIFSKIPVLDGLKADVWESRWNFFEGLPFNIVKL